MTMKMRICVSTIAFLCLTCLAVGIAVCCQSQVAETCAITFGTFSYHFLMRLLVGGVVHTIKHNQFDYTRWWFQPRRFEEAFYKRICMKSWKKNVPVFAPDMFDLKKHSVEAVAMATCQAEVIHELIVLFSFVPLLFSHWFGAFWVFALTSMMAACMDMFLVLVQRFNRPRLLNCVRGTEKYRL